MDDLLHTLFVVERKELRMFYNGNFVIRAIVDALSRVAQVQHYFQKLLLCF